MDLVTAATEVIAVDLAIAVEVAAEADTTAEANKQTLLLVLAIGNAPTSIAETPTSPGETNAINVKRPNPPELVEMMKAAAAVAVEEALVAEEDSVVAIVIEEAAEVALAAAEASVAEEVTAVAVVALAVVVAPCVEAVVAVIAVIVPTNSIPHFPYISAALGVVQLRSVFEKKALGLDHVKNS